MSDLTAPQPTHRLGETLLVQKEDKKGKLFYLDVSTGKFAKLDGLEPEPIPASEEAPEESLPAPLETPVDVESHVFAVVMSAWNNPYGVADKGGVSGRKHSENEVILTVPGPKGDDVRYIVTIPERIAVRARPYDIED